MYSWVQMSDLRLKNSRERRKITRFYKSTEHKIYRVEFTQEKWTVPTSYRWKYKRKDIADKDVHFLTQKSSYILLIIPFKHNLETSSKCICLGAEFKEFEPRLKFKLRIKDGWFQLKLYSLLQDLSRGSIETGFWRITDEAQIHYTWTFILCVFWVYFECILSLFWVYFECILSV